MPDFFGLTPYNDMGASPTLDSSELILNAARQSPAKQKAGRIQICRKFKQKQADHLMHYLNNCSTFWKNLRYSASEGMEQLEPRDYNENDPEVWLPGAFEKM